MKRFFICNAIILLITLTIYFAAAAQESESLESGAIIQKILEVDAKQRSEVQSVVFDAEYIEKESNGKGGYEEKVRLEKKIRIKYLPDTVWYNEEYLRYIKNNEVRSPEECDEIAADRKDKKKRRGARDISWPMLDPFKPENRGAYQVAYVGVDDSAAPGYMCHHFKITATSEDENRIHGDYYFDAATLQLVKVDFWPAKLGGNLLFKLDQLKMSLAYAPTSGGYWLPREFVVTGKGKAAFFIDIDWQGVEYFTNPQINTQISDDIFKADRD